MPMPSRYTGLGISAGPSNSYAWQNPAKGFRFAATTCREDLWKPHCGARNVRHNDPADCMRPHQTCKEGTRRSDSLEEISRNSSTVASIAALICASVWAAVMKKRSRDAFAGTAG